MGVGQIIGWLLAASLAEYRYISEDRYVDQRKELPGSPCVPMRQWHHRSWYMYEVFTSRHFFKVVDSTLKWNAYGASYIPVYRLGWVVDRGSSCGGNLNRGTKLVRLPFVWKPFFLQEMRVRTRHLAQCLPVANHVVRETPVRRSPRTSICVPCELNASRVVCEQDAPRKVDQALQVVQKFRLSEVQHTSSKKLWTFQLCAPPSTSWERSLGAHGKNRGC